MLKVNRFLIIIASLLFVFSLVSCGGGGDGDGEASSNGTAPSGLTYTLIHYNYSSGVLTGASVNLTWQHDLVDVIGFKIERNGSQVGTSSDTSYTDGIAYSGGYWSGGPQYKYRVKAYNNAGDSGYSNVLSIDLSAGTPTTTIWIPTTTIWIP